MIKIFAISTSALLMLFSNVFNTQQKEMKNKKLKKVTTELVVNVSPEKAWEVLSSFGDVGSYHSGIITSKSLNGSQNKAVLACERECVLSDGKKPIVVRERITEIKAGKYFTYQVYDAENFPLTEMFVTFGVRSNEKQQTVLYFENNFLLKPKFISGLMKGKIRKGGKDALTAYKHFMETGEKNVDMKKLKKMYK
jgi:hypothetical protein